MSKHASKCWDRITTSHLKLGAIFNTKWYRWKWMVLKVWSTHIGPKMNGTACKSTRLASFRLSSIKLPIVDCFIFKMECLSLTLDRHAIIKVTIHLSAFTNRNNRSSLSAEAHRGMSRVMTWSLVNGQNCPVYVNRGKRQAAASSVTQLTSSAVMVVVATYLWWKSWTSKGCMRIHRLSGKRFNLLSKLCQVAKNS